MRLRIIGDQHHHEVRACHSIPGSCSFEPEITTDLSRRRFVAQTDHDINAAVMKIECMCPSLGAEAEYGNAPAQNERRISILVVIDRHNSWRQRWPDQRPGQKAALTLLAFDGEINREPAHASRVATLGRATSIWHNAPLYRVDTDGSLWIQHHAFYATTSRDIKECPG